VSSPEGLKIGLKRADVFELVQADALLKTAPLVKALGAKAAEVLRQGVARRFPASALVFQQGEAGDSLFLVLRGQVRVFARPGTDTVELAQVAKGEVFGEREILESLQVRSASAQAESDADLVELPRALVAQKAGPLFQYLSALNTQRQAALNEMNDFLSRW
jgi:CRP/FNR family transcriptional regulator, cyclic AMP receptor protein